MSDYPPWTAVREIASGTFAWQAAGGHRGDYTVQWLPVDQREAVLGDLGIQPEAF